jgi:hypothetical protein
MNEMDDGEAVNNGYAVVGDPRALGKMVQDAVRSVMMCRAVRSIVPDGPRLG